MLHAYSAYYDNREPDVYKFGLVRVFTLYNDDRFLNGRRWALRCRLRYTLPGGTDIELVRLSYVINSTIHTVAGLMVPGCSITLTGTILVEQKKVHWL